MAAVQKNPASDQTSCNIRMNDDAQLYSDSNHVTRRDAVQCLEEYARKLKWKRSTARILDIGSADGTVTSIFAKYIPNDYDKLIGCDINKKSVEFANDRYGDERTNFIVLDIESDLPHELKESFDHVVSFCTFQWIRNQEKGFTNIYNLLSEDGECLMTILGQSTMYTIFAALSRTEKWEQWLTECDKFISPYYDCHHPDEKIADMLKKIGFHNIDVRCKQKNYNYESIEHYENIVRAINPFKFSEGLEEDFFHDYMQLARDMGIVNKINNNSPPGNAVKVVDNSYFRINAYWKHSETDGMRLRFAFSVAQSFKMRMNDDAQLFSDNNHVTRRDVIQCLEEYASKLKWKRTGARILDIGCADGSVTRIFAKNIPNDYEKVIGCDINEKMVEFANDNHGDERMHFIVLDIEGHLPDKLKERFDHVFSSCTFQWIRNQEKGFTNIYNLLSGDGECLVTILAQSTIYTLYTALSRTEKWGRWLTECEKFLSPYHDCHHPEGKITDMLKKIGFHYIDVRCKQKMYEFESVKHYKNILTAVNPFKFPEGLFEDFLNDYMQLAQDMGIVNKINNTVTFNYNLLIIHCRK